MSNLIEIKRKDSIIGLPPEQDFPVHSFSLSELLKMEKEILGIYAQEHPLTLYRKKLNSMKRAGQLLIRSHHIEQLRSGQSIIISGLLIQVRRQFTINRQVMAFLLLEDETGLFEAIAFPEIFKRYFSLLSKEQLLIIKGKISKKSEEEKIIVEEIKNLYSCLEESSL